MDGSQGNTEGAIAVIGMACRYPGATDTRRYWAALRAGVEGITHFRPDDLVAAGAAPDLVRRADYVPARGFLEGSHSFDWPAFGYSRAEAASIDPQQRIFLECAAHAFDDAGHDPARFPGWIGTYAGAEGVTLAEQDEADPLTQLIGTRPDFLTTRVAYKLGLRGPAVTVQTACSTSLTAVHMAAQSLLTYECDMALAGGVSLLPRGEWGYVYQEGGILSPDGHCRPFDDAAAGTVPGEGVGIVVLKRLEDALHDGDRVAGLVLGSGLSNDGGDKIGYTAPSIPGQRDAILLAQRVADVDPADIDYVEAHGTGTRVGDPVELQALTDAFRRSTDAVGQCWIGAVKSNIGHTGSASGVAGLIKTLLMMEHGELVPTLHYHRPNSLLDLDPTPFRICAKLRPWPDRGSKLAAVSSFGVGGTNAHLVVAGPPAQAGPASRRGAHMLTLSGASPTGRAGLRQALAERLETEPEVSLAETACTLAERRRYSWRQAVVAESVREAAELLRTVPEPPRHGSLDRVAFLFPGQGTLNGAAGAAAYHLLPGFRTAFEEWRSLARDTCDVDLTPVVVPGSAGPGWFRDTVNQQLGLLALGHALARQLVDWGVVPVALLGNSIGEYAAATLSGVWTPGQTVRVVHARASAMRDTEPGRMATIEASPDEVSRRIAGHDQVSVAVAGSGRTVLSGPTGAMDKLLDDDVLRDLAVRPLDVNRAFHSAAMESAVRALRNTIGAVPGRAGTLPLVSNVTGEWSDPVILRSQDYWAEQLRGTVRLADGLTTLFGADCDTFVELGQGTSMTGALRRHRDWDPAFVALPLLGRGEAGGEHDLLRPLGVLWERGASFDPADFLGDVRPQRCSLPAHPFDVGDPEAEPRVQSRGDARAKPATGTTSSPTPGGSLRSRLEQLWRQTLGVSTVADSDDFMNLGGESLMAVNLMSAVREDTAAGVAVAEFLKAPTFGRLAELVERDRSGAVPSALGMVTLREGRGNPLFLAPDALGSAASYRALAEALDTTRPVYGLEVADIGGRRGGHERIEEIAARHVATLRQAQPSGPYTVGGWSFGAVVAHEIARQLVQSGAAVDALICLDGFAPDRRGFPIAADPGFLAGNLRLQIDALLGVGKLGERLGKTPMLRWRFIAGIGALLRYRPRPVPCRALVVRADANTRNADRLERALAGMYTRVSVRTVRGDHWSILDEPHVRAVGIELDAVLCHSDSSRESAGID